MKTLPTSEVTADLNIRPFHQLFAALIQSSQLLWADVAVLNCLIVLNTTIALIKAKDSSRQQNLILIGILTI